MEFEDDLVSNCCGAEVIKDTDLCLACMEHCLPVNVHEYYEGDEE